MPDSAGDLLFLVQEFFLPFQSPAVTTQALIASDHAMARYDQSDGIGGTGSRHGADRSGTINCLRNFSIGSRRAIGNRAQRFPHKTLERGRLYVEWQNEIGTFAAQMFQYLLDRIHYLTCIQFHACGSDFR